MIPASDRTVSRNDNGAPRDERQPREECARLFAKILTCVSHVLESEAVRVLMKRQPMETRHTRMLVCWAAYPHIPQVEMAAITTLNRSTLRDDYEAVENWRARNTMFRELTDMIADHVEPIPGIHKFKDDLMEEMRLEALADREARALAAIRQAAASLERPPLRLVKG